MIFNINKKIAILLLAVLMWIAPVNAFAIVGTMLPGFPFGGIVIVTLPCSCSVNLWIWFSPLYLSPKPGLFAGPLVYAPYETTLYGDFAIGVPSTWHLGSYLPGVQACWQYVGEACVIMKNYGLMNKVGTSLP